MIVFSIYFLTFLFSFLLRLLQQPKVRAMILGLTLNIYIYNSCKHFFWSGKNIKCDIMFMTKNMIFYHFSGLGIYKRKKVRRRGNTHSFKKKELAQKKSSLKKTCSRPRKRPRKKNLFVFLVVFFDAFLVESVCS